MIIGDLGLGRGKGPFTLRKIFFGKEDFFCLRPSDVHGSSEDKENLSVQGKFSLV